MTVNHLIKVLTEPPETLETCNATQIPKIADGAVAKLDNKILFTGDAGNHRDLYTLVSEVQNMLRG